MAKKALNVHVELDIQAVTCPGVWLCPHGRVYLQVCTLSSSLQTQNLLPIFPLLFHEQFVLGKTFNKAGNLTELVKCLSREPFRACLVQRTEDDRTIKLATFRTLLLDILFPSPRCYARIAGTDVDLLMHPTRCFPGIIAPKIEISTKVTIEETLKGCHLTKLVPKTLTSEDNVKNQHQKRHQRSVCHSSKYHAKKHKQLKISSHDNHEQLKIASHANREQPKIASHANREQLKIAPHANREQLKIASHVNTDQLKISPHTNRQQLKSSSPTSGTKCVPDCYKDNFSEASYTESSPSKKKHDTSDHSKYCFKNTNKPITSKPPLCSAYLDALKNPSPEVATIWKLLPKSDLCYHPPCQGKKGLDPETKETIRRMCNCREFSPSPVNKENAPPHRKGHRQKNRHHCFRLDSRPCPVHCDIKDSFKKTTNLNVPTTDFCQNCNEASFSEYEKHTQGDYLYYLPQDMQDQESYPNKQLGPPVDWICFSCRKAYGIA